MIYFYPIYMYKRIPIVNIIYYDYYFMYIYKEGRKTLGLRPITRTYHTLLIRVSNAKADLLIPTTEVGCVLANWTHIPLNPHVAWNGAVAGCGPRELAANLRCFCRVVFVVSSLFSPSMRGTTEFLVSRIPPPYAQWPLTASLYPFEVKSWIWNISSFQTLIIHFELILCTIIVVILHVLIWNRQNELTILNALEREWLLRLRHLKWLDLKLK